MTDIDLKERLKLIGLCLLFIGFVGLAVFEFKWFQNTLEAKKLVGIFAIIGLGIGIYIGHLFSKTTKDLVEKMRWYFIFAAVGLTALPLIGGVTNRALSFSNYENRTVELFNQQGFLADMGIIEGQDMNPDGYFTFLVIDGKLERFKSEKVLYPNNKKGDKVEVLMKKGLYGFWIVKVE